MKNRRKWKRLIILLLSLILLISALEKSMLPDGQERKLLSSRFSAASRAEKLPPLPAGSSAPISTSAPKEASWSSAPKSPSSRRTRSYCA